MAWYSRLRNLTRGDALSRDLDREMQFHLSERADQLVAQGMNEDDARREARRRFGHVQVQKERTRDADIVVWLESLVADVRYALRALRHSPAFTFVAVLSIALGVGANTAIFSLINVLMLRSLPVKDPGSLVEVFTHRGKGHFNSFSWQTYRHFRDNGHTFSDLVASYRDRLYTWVPGLDPEKVEAQLVTGNYFPMLGVRPALGRLISPEDDHMGSPAHVAVLSWSFWENRLGRDPGVVGKKITIENVPVTVVGVAPAGFFGTQVGWTEDIFVPLAMEPLIRARSLTGDASNKWLQLIGRSRPGVSLDQVHAEMNVLFRRTLEIEAADRHESKIPDWTIDVAAAGAARA